MKIWVENELSVEKKQTFLKKVYRKNEKKFAEKTKKVRQKSQPP